MFVFLLCFDLKVSQILSFMSQKRFVHGYVAIKTLNINRKPRLKKGLVRKTLKSSPEDHLRRRGARVQPAAGPAGATRAAAVCAGACRADIRFSL